MTLFDKGSPPVACTAACSLCAVTDGGSIEAKELLSHPFLQDAEEEKYAFMESMIYINQNKDKLGKVC